ncbi:A2ML1 protein, partial [Himantopus himantopus]|nr:A2ML1 protein [Himantopus himantopus]
QTGRNGCFSTEVPVASFNLTGFYVSRLYAYASLQEEETGTWRTANKSCMFVYETAKITFENTDDFYKPGIPYTGTMLLKATNSSAVKEKEFLLVVTTGGETTQRKTLLTDGSGRASFELDTSGWKYEISLRAELKDDSPASDHEGKKYFNYQSVHHYLYPISSDSKSFLKLRRVEKKLPCGQPQKLWVDYLFDEKAMETKLQSLDVVFLILAKGTITTVLRKELPAEAGLRGSFSLELPIGPELAPTAKVLGYVVLPNGEMVADSTKLNVAKCFPNKVNLSFSEQRALVGSQLHLKVQAAPGSLCAIYAVDQRAQSSSPKSKLKPSMVSRFLASEGDGKAFRYFCPSASCYSLSRVMFQDADLKTVTNAQLGCAPSIQLQRHQLLPYSPGERRESGTAGMVAAEGRVGTSCLFPSFLAARSSRAPVAARPEEDKQAGGVVQDTGTQMDFLGTWLWELVPVGEGGSTEITVTVPDAITEWEARMFCTSPLGLGMAPATTLTAFKPFFVELALPYTVVRHEAFTLVATVFNYLRQCLRVQVTLVESAELEVLTDMDQGAYRVCVCADEERTFQWSIRATSVGEVNVTVIAKALHTKKLCGTEVPVVPAQGHVDTETKLLRVQVS